MFIGTYFYSCECESRYRSIEEYGETHTHTHTHTQRNIEQRYRERKIVGI